MNETQLNILEWLARYKFLTSSQVLRISGFKNINTAWRNVKILRDQKYIDQLRFPVIPKQGQLEHVNYLTKKGVKFLIENLNFDESQIKYPVGTSSLFFKDYSHRISTIRFFIELDLMAKKYNEEVYFFDYYFDKIGGNRGDTSERLRASTKLNIEGGYVICDGITKFTHNNTDFLYLFEQHNGKDTKRLVNDIESLAIALQEGSASKQYDFNRSARVVFVVQSESVLNSLFERMPLKTNLSSFKQLFIFKLQSDLENKSFSQNWLYWDGSPALFTK